MPRDDDQPETEQVGPRWNAKTAPLEPRRRAASDEPPRRASTDEPRHRASSDAPATEPTVRDSDSRPSAPSRFKLRDELGRGGMGSVYAAHDSVLGREVAIKQALADDAGALRLFEREAKITAQLEHPSIVPVHDAGRDEQGRPYYIMRRLEGQPLADRISRAPDVQARLALVPYVLAAVDAAAFAHARGVIHRDIKPWNILIGDYGETVLIDWGLARRLDDKDADEVFESRAVGTPGYMAPEQVRGEVIDTRADVYALGATLLHVLIGKPALDTTPTEWMEQTARGPAPPVDKLDAAVPVELVAIVTKAMAPSARDRYADAVEMAADLRAFLTGKLVAAHRYTTAEKITRFVRRHRVAVATATAALIAIAVIAVLAIENVIVERDRAREAEAQAADRAELMLVERASTLANHDPTRAVALLRTLPPASRYLARARDIATKASANGIAHGRKVHNGRVRAMAFAPDGRLATTGDDGTLQVHDIHANTSRTIVRAGKPLADLVWADRGATIVYGSEDNGVFAVDVASGAVRTLDAKAASHDIALSASEDRVLAHDQVAERVVAYSTRPGVAPVVIAEQARLAAFHGDRVLVAGNQTVRLYDSTGEHVMWRDAAVDNLVLLAFSDTGSLVATATMTEVIEWDSTTFKQRQRWAQPTALAFYAGERLYANNRARNGALDMMSREILEAAHGDWSVVWTSAAANGTVALAQKGELAYTDGDAMYVFANNVSTSRAVAGRRGSPFVAFGSTTGWIRWLDLRMLVPKAFEIPGAAQMCGLDAGHVYVRSLLTNELLALPRGDGDMRALQVRAFDCLAGDVGPGVAVLEGTDSWAIADGETGQLRHVKTKALGAWKGSYFYVVDHNMIELTHNAERTIWTAPGEIRIFAINDDWIAVDLADSRLLRVNRRTGKSAFVGVTMGVDHIRLQADGTIWFTIGARLYRGDHTVALVGTLPSAVENFGVLPDGRLIAVSNHKLTRIDDRDGTMQTTTLVEHVRSLGGTRTATSLDGFAKATLKYLDTGEEVTRNSRGAIGAMVDDGCLVLYIGRKNPRIEIYQDPVPQDPNQLHAWIDKATNAVLEPGSDELTWR